MPRMAARGYRIAFVSARQLATVKWHEQVACVTSTSEHWDRPDRKLKRHARVLGGGAAARVRDGRYCGPPFWFFYRSIDMTAWAFKSATELAKAIQSGQTTSVALLEYFLRRVDRFNPDINAIIVDDRVRAMERAREADTALAEGTLWGPLHGVPMTAKESYNVAGLVTTHGIAQYANNVAEQDALSVARLKSAGAVLFGKTNVPLRLADFQSYNEIYGTTSNPYDHDRIPGGSSGGSSAALAAGITGLEIGSDIGGSIRNPAHFSGVFGHKPTWNLLPPRGHALPGILSPSDISVIGPLARSPDDLELALHVMAGPNEIEARGLQVNLTRNPKPISEWKVAVWPTDELAPVTGETQDRVKRAGDAFAKAGAKVSETARPDFDPAHAFATFQSLLQPVMASRLRDDEFDDLVAKAGVLDASDERPGAMLLRRQTAYHRDWIRANEARTHLRWAWHRFFKDWDVLLTPVMAIPAFEHDHRPMKERTVEVDGQTRPYFEQVFWAGLIGGVLLPATVAPSGLNDDGLPIGVQIAGPEYGDLDTIAAARFLEKEAGFSFVPPKGYAD